jgi:hypothetical protein
VRIDVLEDEDEEAEVIIKKTNNKTSADETEQQIS